MEQLILTKEGEATTGPKLNILGELLTVSSVWRVHTVVEAAVADRVILNGTLCLGAEPATI
ncbi:hypothetical protein N7465_011825 [Penicillium sp. CMV-2018d]|nr:hypothetical protein N7465_011825 [Penicillium sp. CMV-2018d]